MKSLLEVGAGLCLVVGLLAWGPGLAVLGALWPLMIVVAALVLLALVVVWCLVPYWLYHRIREAAGLSPGFLLRGLQWWLREAYGLMSLLLAGALLCWWPSTAPLERLAAYHVLLWLPAMVLALLPAWVGFWRSQRS